MLRPYTRTGLSTIVRRQHHVPNIIIPNARLLSSKTSKFKNENVSQQRRRNRSRKAATQKKTSFKHQIKEMEEHLNGLREDISKLSILPDIFTPSHGEPISKKSQRKNDSQDYDDLNRRAQSFMNRLQRLIEHQAQERRHTREASELLQEAFCLFPTSFLDCNRIINLAQKNNLNLVDLTPAIEAACREGKWKEAADLFNSRIDPDVSGYAPMLIDIERPLGLYAIAKDAQQRQLPLAETVMDAVMKMSMVNPTDQERYVLAAGVALGHIGGWREIKDYQASSFNSKRLGQTLIGASMYACLRSGEKVEAIELYQRVAKGLGIEWQWSGGSEVLEPIVRDLAMRAGSPEASHLYKKAKEEGCQVSIQALISVIEGSEDVNDILQIMDGISDDTSWIVDGDKLEIMHHSKGDNTSKLERDQLEYLTLMAARKLNHMGEFGLSMLCYEILLCDHQQSSDWYEETREWLHNSKRCDAHLSTLMTALCGFEEPRTARTLYKVVSKSNDHEYPLSSGLYHFVNDTHEMKDGWSKLHQSVRLLLALTSDLPENSLAPFQGKILLTALAKVMQTFNDAKHPRAALLLSRKIQMKIQSLLKSSFSGMVHSFLKNEEVDKPNYTLLAMSDEFLAETIRANKLLDLSDQALPLFHETMKFEDKLKYDDIPLAVNQVLETLISIKQEDVAFQMFQSLEESAWTPEMFIVLGQAMEKKKDFEMVGQLYRQALQCGCLTEKMGLIALKAINDVPHLENKIITMRGIVREIGRVTGQVDNEWLYDKYWELRKTLGRRHSRLLMRWNDSETSDLHELQLAIEHFIERKKEGLRPRYDALRAILKHSRHYKTFSRLIKQKGMNLPVEKNIWRDLVLHVAVEAQNCSLRDDSDFINSLVSVLRNLDETTKADKYLSEAILRGVRVDKSLKI